METLEHRLLLKSTVLDEDMRPVTRIVEDWCSLADANNAFYSGFCVRNTIARIKQLRPSELNNSNHITLSLITFWSVSFGFIGRTQFPSFYCKAHANIAGLLQFCMKSAIWLVLAGCVGDSL